MSKTIFTNNRLKMVLGVCSTILVPHLLGATEDGRPNIIVFIADDAGMDFGCYGNKNIKTPNVDWLAEQGMRFEKAFLTAPQSSPSRSSMMTGEFAHTIGVEDLHMGIGEDVKMMPYYFSRAGYYTGSMLKTHWGDNGTAQFDRRIEDSKGQMPDLDAYKEFIDESGDAPFFLWCGFYDPHRTYDRNVCPQVNDPSKIDVPPYLVDSKVTKRDMADYYDEISRMDSQIGQMLDILREKGELDNSIIVFLSDNGMPFPRCKGSLYDSGIQTPLIFMWQGKIEAGSVHNNGLISSIDLSSTLFELTDVEMNDPIYGESFMPILMDGSKRGRDYIFAERNWHNTDEYIRCIRSEDMKLIYNAYYELPHGTASDISSSLSWYELKRVQKKGRLKKDQKQIFTAPRAMIELYDLTKDPNELNNVADEMEYINEGRKLGSKLVEWQKQTKDHNWWERRRQDNSDRITGFNFKSNNLMMEFYD